MPMRANNKPASFHGPTRASHSQLTRFNLMQLNHNIMIEK